MAAPNMNGRLHLTDGHQNSPASLLNPLEHATAMINEFS